MPLTREEMLIWRSLRKTGVVLLLLGRLGRGSGESEIARILEIDVATARAYLRALADLGLVERERFHRGYALSEAGRDLLASANPRIARVGTDINIIKPESIQTEELIITGAPEGNSQVPEEGMLWAALQEAGILRNLRTERLVRMPHLSPDYITAHHLQLQRAGRGGETGLLVTILESGAPAPGLNDNRHLRDCRCEECQRLRYRTCWYCGAYPCQCDDQEDEDVD